MELIDFKHKLWDLTFLEQGHFTRIDDTVRELAERVQYEYKEVGSLHGKISRYIGKGLQHSHPRKHPIRSRTASEIIQSGYEEGCSDMAIVFAAIARSLGMPTEYVETLAKKFLEGPEEMAVDGHAFVRIFIDGRWKPYCPKTGFTPDRKFSLNRQSEGLVEFVELGKGLDFCSVHLKNSIGVYCPHPENMQNIYEKAQEIKRENGANLLLLEQE
jgi:hypothetical protein